MAIKTPPQTLIDTGSDSTLNKIYANNLQSIPTVSSGQVYVTTTQEFVTNIITGAETHAAGNTTEVQFNTGSGFTGDAGLTYDAASDSLTVSGVVYAGTVRTNSLQHSNGVAWSLDNSSSYSDSNVAAYLPTHTGNVSADYFIGNGSSLTNITGANVTGTVANATHASSANTANTATTAATVTTGSQPNITSLGTLSSLIVSGNANVSTLNITSKAILGPVSNITINGGTPGQYLSTDGSGNLSWTTTSSGAFNGGTITSALTIEDQTESTSYTSGALLVSGGAGFGGNVHVNGHFASNSTVYAGHFADLSSWNNPVFVGKDAGADYIQSALVNSSGTGSADFAAYGDSSTTDTGWVDMGFTGTAFNDPLYTITKPSDGYVFVQGLDSAHGGPQGGNLVIATGGQGSNNDVVFALGSFLANAEYARMDDDSNTFYVGGHAYGATVGNPTPRVVSLNVNGTTTSAGKIGYSKGGTATQTARGQSVTINELTGKVTMASATMAAGDVSIFIINCNKVSANDYVMAQLVDSSTTMYYVCGAYPHPSIANAIQVWVRCLEAIGADTPVVKFLIMKAPIA